jgi:hypothetical protein
MIIALLNNANLVSPSTIFFRIKIMLANTYFVDWLPYLFQEIKFLSQFKHENIVQYYGSEIVSSPLSH